MLRKLSLILLSFILALYPSTVMAADVNTGSEQDDNIIEVEVNEENEDLDVVLDEDEDATEDNVAEDVEVAIEEDAVAENEDADEVDESSDEAIEDADHENADEATEGTFETEEADSVEATKAEVEEDDSDEEIENTEYNLNSVYGDAKGTISYDYNQGHYNLEGKVNINNYSSQDIVDPWVAFALPENVQVIGEVSSGVELVRFENNRLYVAVKVPDVGSVKSERANFNLSLIGDGYEANPDLNTYLLEYTDEEFLVHGQLNGEREINFDVMGELPEYDLDGGISGTITFDDGERHYVLGLSVNVTNNLPEDLTDVYSAFPLPADVVVLQSDLDLRWLETGDVAFKLPDLAAGESAEFNLAIPLMGQTDEHVKSSVINLYKFTEQGYYELGQFDGSIDIDFSVMDIAWTFDAQAQIVKDFPDVEANQFGLQFAFDTQNLTIHEVDEVVVEFNVPETITVHAPDSYSGGDVPDALKDFLDQDAMSGNLDIEWEGNKAIINLNTVQGTQWNQGYFTALGESTQPLEDLEGLEVTVMLFKDGTEVVEQIKVPFEIVSYDGEPGDPTPEPEDPEDPAPEPEDPEDPEQPEDPEDPTPEPEDPEDPEQPEDPTPEDPETPETPEEPGDDDEGEDGENGEDDDGDKGKDKDGDDDDDGKDDGGTGTDKGDGDGSRLPDTATNMYTFILIGSILTLAGGALMFFRRKRIA